MAGRHHSGFSCAAPGLTIYRSDRSRNETGKARGRGVCILVNDRWATDVKILSKTCSVDIETLTIVCWPFYLPRDFSNILLTAVYISPEAYTDAAVIQLSEIVMQAEVSQPDSFVIVTGDFNKANPKKEMPKFIQQVTCATRDGRTLLYNHQGCVPFHPSRTTRPLGPRHGLPSADLQTAIEAC